MTDAKENVGALTCLPPIGGTSAATLRFQAGVSASMDRTIGVTTMQIEALSNLDALAKDVSAHLDRLGVERSDWVRVAKVGEEGGEVVGALIKRSYGAADTADVLNELGDVFLAAIAAADQLGVTPSEVIVSRWAQVLPRSGARGGGPVDPERIAG